MRKLRVGGEREWKLLWSDAQFNIVEVRDRIANHFGAYKYSNIHVKISIPERDGPSSGVVECYQI